MNGKRLYYVHTHVGTFETWAETPKKAIANIRYRLFGRGCGGRWCDTGSWEAVAA